MEGRESAWEWCAAWDLLQKHQAILWQLVSLLTKIYCPWGTNLQPCLGVEASGDDINISPPLKIPFPSKGTQPSSTWIAYDPLNVSHTARVGIASYANV